MRKYSTFDSFKFISSLFIVGIHILTMPFEPRKSIQESMMSFQIFQVIGRFAVPFFFITSSFLFFRKYLIQDNRQDRLKYRDKAIVRIFKLYFFWFVVLLPVTAINKFHYGQHGNYILDLIYLIKDFFLGETFGASWYLSSSIFCILVLVFLLDKGVSTKIMLLLTGTIQIICVVTSVYGNVVLHYVDLRNVYSILEYPSLSIVGGLFYFNIGYVIAKYEETIYAKFSTAYAILITAIGFLLIVVEINAAMVNNWVYTTDQAFSLVIAASGLVLICIKLGSYGNNTILSYLRSLSTITYMSHLGLNTVIIVINNQFLHLSILKNKLFLYVTIVLGTWILAFIIRKLVKSRFLKISNILKYSY